MAKKNLVRVIKLQDGTITLNTRQDQNYTDDNLPQTKVPISTSILVEEEMTKGAALYQLDIADGKLIKDPSRLPPDEAQREAAYKLLEQLPADHHIDPRTKQYLKAIVSLLPRRQPKGS